MNIVRLTVADPQGTQRTARMPPNAYLQMVGATNFKQRTPKMIEYHHADRLRYAVAGTPNEKLVLKRVANGLVPDEIIERHKQPYRAPDAISFTGDPVLEWVGELTSERYVADAGIFDPPVVARLWRKCRASSAVDFLSNADNMALVGVLSTGLLYEQLVRAAPERTPATRFATLIDEVQPSSTRSALASGWVS